jgi:hypothetical protein
MIVLPNHPSPVLPGHRPALAAGFVFLGLGSPFSATQARANAIGQASAGSVNEWLIGPQPCPRGFGETAKIFIFVALFPNWWTSELAAE